MLRSRFLLVVAFALVLAACGGSAEVAGPAQTDTTATSSQPKATTTTETTANTVPGRQVSATLSDIQAAMDRTTMLAPARIEGLIEVVADDPDLGLIEISLPLSISYDAASGDGAMLMDFSSVANVLGDELPTEFAGVFDRFEIRQIGDTAYLRFGLLNMMFGVETEWISMPIEEGQGFAQDFSNGAGPTDPAAYLETLANAYGEVTEIGRETLRGVETTHYLAVFDIAALAEQDPAAFAELDAMGPIGLDALPIDIWIDDEGLVHRFLMELDGSTMSDLPSDDQFDSMRMQFDFSDYGGSVTIEQPPGDQVTDVDDLDNIFGDLEV